MRKTSVIYFYYTAKTQKKGTFYHSKCKRFLKLMTLSIYKAFIYHILVFYITFDTILHKSGSRLLL